MKKLLLSIAAFFLITTSVIAVTYNSDPKIFITEVVNDAIKILSDKSTDKKKKRKVSRKNCFRERGYKSFGNVHSW
jgi:ABC-type transporter MlaC component